MNVFISYSHKDRDWCDRLANHLLGIDGGVVSDIWYDTRISPGRDYDAEILSHLQNADIVVLLISENFVGATFCLSEVKRALELHRQNHCVIVPVLLRHCVYKKLQLGTMDPSPHGHEPIDSVGWSDKALALKTVAEEVQAVARERQGMAPRRRPLSVDIPKVTNLLHMHCDRGPQKTALHTALAPERVKARKPFVMIVLGHYLDCPDRYLERITSVILKRYLPDSIHQLTPLQWPEEGQDQDPLAIFGASLSESLLAPPYSSLERMNKGLCSLNAVNVLPSWITADSWNARTEKLILTYLRLWNAWPRLPRDRYLMPVVVILYRTGERINPRIPLFLKDINAGSYPNVEIASLPELQKVILWDFQQWLILPEVREALPSPERALVQSSQLPDIPKRIYDLANTDLPKFLGTL